MAVAIPLIYPLHDPRTQLSVLNMISLFRDQPNAQAAIDYFAAAQPGSFQARYYGLDADSCGMLWFRYGEGKNLILSQGTRGLTHVPNLVAGWRDYQNDSRHQGISGAFWTAANLLGGRIKQFARNGEEFGLYGHSYGGAQLHALALLLKQWYPDANVHGCSYGSPRPGNAQFSLLVDNITFYRWYNNEDPVAKSPPRYDEAPILHFGLPPTVSRGMNTQMHAGQGMKVFNDGSFEQTDVSTIGLIVNQVSIASWLVGGNAYGAQTHQLDEYRRRFSLMPIEQPLPAPRVGEPRSRMDAPINRPFSDVRRSVVEATQRSMVRQTVLPRSDVPQVLPVAGTTRYRIRRISGSYCVLAGNDVYAICATKREARQIRSEWNRSASRPVPQEPMSPEAASEMLKGS